MFGVGRVDLVRGGDVRHVHDMFGVDRVDLVGVTCGMYTICLEWIEWTW